MTTVTDTDRNDSLMYLPVVPQHEMNYYDAETYVLYSRMLRNRWRQQNTTEDVTQQETPDQVLLETKRTVLFNVQYSTSRITLT